MVVADFASNAWPHESVAHDQARDARADGTLIAEYKKRRQMFAPAKSL